MIDVVVPVFNQFELVTQCLDTLRYQEGIGQIIVVDDGSTDGSVKDYLDAQEDITLVRHDSNAGFVEAANNGMTRAKTEFVVLVNSDVAAIGQSALKTLVMSMLDHEANVGGAKLLFMSGSRFGEPWTIQHAGVAFDPAGRPYHPFMHLHRRTAAANVPRFVNAVTGAVFGVRYSVWITAGGFRMVFSPGVYEDVDYCLRVGRVWYEPRSEWLHLMHGSQQDRNLFADTKRQLEKLHRIWGLPSCDEELFYGV